MSTPRWKKEQRQKELMAQAIRRKQEKAATRSLFGTKSQKNTKDDFKEYVMPDVVRRDEGVVYKSYDSGQHNTYKVEPQKYTGTLVKGIGTMHKSNAVPIISKEEAIDIANMRRN